MKKASKGETKVANLLRRAGVPYQTEFTFNNLKGVKEKLRFDFAFKYRGFLILCEVDGIQHFQYTPHFHKSPADFRRQKEYDIKKNKYCLSNNIPLIRIPYWAIENLTFERLISTQDFIVRTPYHNINLIDKGVRK